jgi:hypothetical protein
MSSLAVDLYSHRLMLVFYIILLPILLDIKVKSKRIYRNPAARPVN